MINRTLLLSLHKAVLSNKANGAKMTVPFYCESIKDATPAEQDGFVALTAGFLVAKYGMEIVESCDPFGNEISVAVHSVGFASPLISQGVVGVVQAMYTSKVVQFGITNKPVKIDLAVIFNASELPTSIGSFDDTTMRLDFDNFEIKPHTKKIPRPMAFFKPTPAVPSTQN